MIGLHHFVDTILQMSFCMISSLDKVTFHLNFSYHVCFISACNIRCHNHMFGVNLVTRCLVT